MTCNTGMFCWYELMTTNTDAAEQFYRGVVGWEARGAGHDAMAYTQFLADGVPAAGLAELPPDASPLGLRASWIGSIAVDDVDEYARRVAAAGGELHRPPADIPGIGRSALVTDPQGVAFVLFKAAGQGAAAVPARSGPGSVGWRELVAEDGASAFAFYSGLFGWSRAGEVDMGAMGIYQLFAAGGAPVGGMMTKPPGMSAAFWTYYFEVEAIGAAAARLQQAGGSVLNGPRQVPGGSWIVQALDPQGTMFALTSAHA